MSRRGNAISPSRKRRRWPEPIQGYCFYPYAIFCDIDAGEDPTDKFERPILKPNKKQWEQSGRQMVDGGHSHPDCKVGP